MITASIQQGLFPAATVLLSPGDAVWAEDPAYSGIVAVLGNFDVSAHIEFSSMPKELMFRKGLTAALVHASLSLHFASISAGNANEHGRPHCANLWVRQNNAWIVEDD